MMALMLDKVLRMKDGPVGQYLTELLKDLAEEIGNGFCDGLSEAWDIQHSNAESRGRVDEVEESDS
jgi:hypothetical protein